MHQGNRHCLFFFDNFSAHQLAVGNQERYFSYLKIEWLPATSSALVQPVDQGIGQTFKLRYRKYLNELKAANILNDNPPLEHFDMLRVVIYLAKAWNPLNGTNTVPRCFSKAGFRHGEEQLELASFEANTDDIELIKEEANMENAPIQDGEEILADDKLDRLLDEDPSEEQKTQEDSDCKGVRLI